jgi:hypothetical protein
MENPLEQPAPEDPIERIHTLARDLAYGITNGLWGTRIYARVMTNGRELWLDTSQINSELDKYLQNKWNHQQLSIDMLFSFGYVSMYEKEDRSEYLLTQKAFALLENPVEKPSVFISYCHVHSSALALLVESRLKLADQTINVFIDKQLDPGDDWQQRLEIEVRQRPYFICLIVPKTLESPNVQKEISWAQDAGCTIIAIWHDGYEMGADYSLGDKQAIIVEEEKAKQYEFAMIDLLNRLGYSTIG